MSQSLNGIDAKKKLFSIKRLPASPKIVQEVINLWKNPDTSMKEYEEAIGRDPGLTTEVLKVVNSPYYGLKNRVSNLRMALSMLGLRETYRIVANRGFHSVFRTVFNNSKYDLNLFWNHSQMTANVAFALAEKFLPQQSSDAYVAGLLHDVGKLCMAKFFPEEWDALIAEYQWQQDEGLELEEKHFDITHSELAAVLLVRWNIPKEIVIPVRYHHDPYAAADIKELVNILYFAEKTATFLMPLEKKKEMKEFFIENETWHRMKQDYPQMNLIDNKDLLEEMRRSIEQEMD